MHVCVYYVRVCACMTCTTASGAARSQGGEVRRAASTCVSVSVCVCVCCVCECVCVCACVLCVCLVRMCVCVRVLCACVRVCGARVNVCVCLREFGYSSFECCDVPGLGGEEGGIHLSECEPCPPLPPSSFDLRVRVVCVHACVRACVLCACVVCVCVSQCVYTTTRSICGAPRRRTHGPTQVALNTQSPTLSTHITHILHTHATLTRTSILPCTLDSCWIMPHTLMCTHTCMNIRAHTRAHTHTQSHTQTHLNAHPLLHPSQLLDDPSPALPDASQQLCVPRPQLYTDALDLWGPTGLTSWRGGRG